MTIHKAGYILLLKILIVLIILNLASFYFINNTSIVYTILGITVVMYLLVVNFFRFPNRVIIQDDNTILAPADGKIVVIEETEEPEYFKDRRLQVSIFMNIFNVHINWFPVNGVINTTKAILQRLIYPNPRPRTNGLPSLSNVITVRPS